MRASRVIQTLCRGHVDNTTKILWKRPASSDCAHWTLHGGHWGLFSRNIKADDWRLGRFDERRDIIGQYNVLLQSKYPSDKHHKRFRSMMLLTRGTLHGDRTLEKRGNTPSLPEKSSLLTLQTNQLKVNDNFIFWLKKTHEMSLRQTKLAFILPSFRCLISL